MPQLGRSPRGETPASPASSTSGSLAGVVHARAANNALLNPLRSSIFVEHAGGDAGVRASLRARDQTPRGYDPGVATGQHGDVSHMHGSVFATAASDVADDGGGGMAGLGASSMPGGGPLDSHLTHPAVIDLVHAATWAVARAFGFQAFNPSSTAELPQYSPGTAFLAADHIQELLTNDMLRSPLADDDDDDGNNTATPRDQSPPPPSTPNRESSHARMCRCAHSLHSTIFGAYRTWLSHVGLPHARLAAAESALAGVAWDDAGAVNGLLMELGAYFLLWSEASSLRHCPEALWFLYHAMSMSPAMARLWECCAGLVPIPGARDRRLVMRNLLQADIGTLQASFRHFPWNGLPASNLDMLSALAGKLPAPNGAPAARGTSLAHPLQGDEALLEDLVAMGDGGSFMDRVIQPLFVVVAFEMDHLRKQGTEAAFHLNYDDINESLTHPGIVRRTLKALGATGTELRSGEAHSAFAGILGLGCEDSSSAAAEGGGDSRQHGAPASSSSDFDEQRAAAFWSEKVFTKTYFDRRSWLSVYRCFYRVFCLQAVLLHLLIAAAFTEGMWSTRLGWDILSSAVITHALCAALERFSNAWMNGRQANPLDKQRSSWAWMEGRLDKKSAAAKRGSAEEGGETEAECPLESARKRRRPVPLEGAPVLGFIGVFEWVLVFFGLAAFFVLQFLTVPGLSEMARTYWLFAAGGYTAAMLMHGILTTRDGYTVGLTASLHLPRFMAAHSARPAPTYWLCGDLGIGWLMWGLTAVFWLVVLGGKAAFDYFVIWRPLVPAVGLFLDPDYRQRFLPCNRARLIPALPIPCVDGAWLLVLIRMLPSMLISFLTTTLVYQLVLVAFGAIQAVTTLDIGVVRNFVGMGAQFHRGPALWWTKLMSSHAKREVLASVGALKEAAAADPAYDRYHSQPGLTSGDHGGSSVSRPSAAPMSLKHGAAAGSGGAGLAQPNGMSMEAMLLGTSDEHVAMWDSFAVAWDEVVDDLREADLLSNAERDNLRFMRLGYSVQGVRPILLPLFWTAGQVQKVVDSGLVDARQTLVLSEMRCLLVFLGLTIRVLPQSFADALMQASFCTEVLDDHHSNSRERMAASLKWMISGMWAISTCVTDMPEDLGRRHALHGDVLSALLELLCCLQVECQAVRTASVRGRRMPRTGVPSAAAVEASEKLLAEIEALSSSLQYDPSGLHSSLRVLHHENAVDPSVSSGPEPNAQTLLKVVKVLLQVLCVRPAEAEPSGMEARRVLQFFMSSLSNSTLQRPRPLHEMPSWSVLTPFYEEDVIYSLQVEAGGSSSSSKTGAPTDLLTETEDNVSLMAYLRSVFPKDWECFKERLGDQLGGLDLSAAVEADFGVGAPLHELGLQLQLWASFRGQLLARTVRGMMCYDKALRVLARLEYPRAAAAGSAGGPKGHEHAQGAARAQYEAWLDRLIEKKFCHIVSAQLYSHHRVSKDPRQRWLAQSLDILLGLCDRLKLAFIDDVGGSQFSVLLRGRRDGWAAEWEHPAAHGSAVEEVYRVRLPRNRYSRRGVIVGEGKPENQNHAVIFAHGEALQTIDMNQDNNLAEALKMRNLLEALYVSEDIFAGFNALLRGADIKWVGSLALKGLTMGLTKGFKVKDLG
ncbi:hypothetical protein FOA52_010848 [Chlamydomonas sp. UWO 241]|nr:hypothetical protein FOA52_010848 [Chlamydomonas sp. UWO 241]